MSTAGTLICALAKQFMEKQFVLLIYEPVGAFMASHTTADPAHANLQLTLQTIKDNCNKLHLPSPEPFHLKIFGEAQPKAFADAMEQGKLARGYVAEASQWLMCQLDKSAGDQIDVLHKSALLSEICSDQWMSQSRCPPKH